MSFRIQLPSQKNLLQEKYDYYLHNANYQQLTHFLQNLIYIYFISTTNVNLLCLFTMECSTQYNAFNPFLQVGRIMSLYIALSNYKILLMYRDIILSLSLQL